jgi:hypothetical protein
MIPQVYQGDRVLIERANGHVQLATVIAIIENRDAEKNVRWKDANGQNLAKIVPMSEVKKIEKPKVSSCLFSFRRICQISGLLLVVAIVIVFILEAYDLYWIEYKHFNNCEQRNWFFKCGSKPSFLRSILNIVSEFICFFPGLAGKIVVSFFEPFFNSYIGFFLFIAAGLLTGYLFPNKIMSYFLYFTRIYLGFKIF